MKQRKQLASEPLPIEAHTALLQATYAASKDLLNDLLPRYFTVKQYGILQTLYTKGPMFQRDIAACVCMRPGNLTPAIDKLEKKALVKRIRMEDDRRYTRIELTPEGRKLVKKIFPKHQKRIMETMEGLTKVDQNHLKRICQNLIMKKKKV